mmetsp:Transcript_1750/g.2264  ORF Transcript_1750/g.2264 Transcript_1750/m.2264 type:complete len:498 (+) Transcript_1750:99-1592(+)
MSSDTNMLTDVKTQKVNAFVYVCTTLACLSSILLGYDIGVMSGAIVYMERDLDLSDVNEEVIISSLNLFSILGAFLGGHFANIYGRRKTIGISALVFFGGAILMAMTKLLTVIILSRVLLGIAAGTGLLIAPLYTAELAPSHVRGKLVTFAEISINCGILLGYLVAFLFRHLPDDKAWRLMVGLGSVPSLMLFIGICIMPESPRWLVEHERIEEARQVLKTVRDDENLVEDELQGIIDDINEEKREMTKSSWLQIMFPCCVTTPKFIKRALYIGVGVSMFQQATGNEAAVYYTPKVFRQAGLSDNMVLLCTIFVGLSKVSFIFISTFSLDRVGRRPLLLTSAITMTITLYGLCLAFALKNATIMTIVFQCLFCASFSIGWGPCVWVIMSEIFPLSIRSRAMGLCTMINRLLSGTVALTFLSLQKLLTPAGTWLFFAIISTLSIIFVYTIPETKGKTLEEITQFLMHGNMSRNKKGYRISDDSEDNPAIELNKRDPNS